MADITVLKVLPASNPEYQIEIQKTTYLHENMKDDWNISAVLMSKNPENKWGIHSITLGSGFDLKYPRNIDRPSEDESVIMIEKYLSKAQRFDEAVKKMVDRWAEQSFSKLFNQNNGDNSPGGGMTFALMNMLSSKAQSNVTEESINIWKNNLTEAMIIGEVRNLYTDYHPDKVLSDACEAAGISTDCIPIKSSGFIDKVTNVCRVSFGYHGKEELL